MLSKEVLSLQNPVRKYDPQHCGSTGRLYSASWAFYHLCTTSAWPFYHCHSYKARRSSEELQVWVWVLPMEGIVVAWTSGKASHAGFGNVAPGTSAVMFLAGTSTVLGPRVFLSHQTWLLFWWLWVGFAVLVGEDHDKPVLATQVTNFVKPSSHRKEWENNKQYRTRQL